MMNSLFLKVKIYIFVYIKRKVLETQVNNITCVFCIEKKKKKHYNKIEKNLKNFTKTIAKLKKLYYNLHEVEKSGTKW